MKEGVCLLLFATFSSISSSLSRLLRRFIVLCAWEAASFDLIQWECVLLTENQRIASSHPYGEIQHRQKVLHYVWRGLALLLHVHTYASLHPSLKSRRLFNEKKRARERAFRIKFKWISFKCGTYNGNPQHISNVHDNDLKTKTHNTKYFTRVRRGIIFSCLLI